MSAKFCHRALSGNALAVIDGLAESPGAMVVAHIAPDRPALGDGRGSGLNNGQANSHRLLRT